MCQNPDFISINGGVQLNLMGEENAESPPAQDSCPASAAVDFPEGSSRSPGGKGFICINSARQTKDGRLKSNIVPCFPRAAPPRAARTLV